MRWCLLNSLTRLCVETLHTYTHMYTHMKVRRLQRDVQLRRRAARHGQVRLPPPRRPGSCSHWHGRRLKTHSRQFHTTRAYTTINSIMLHLYPGFFRRLTSFLEPGLEPSFTPPPSDRAVGRGDLGRRCSACGRHHRQPLDTSTSRHEHRHGRKPQKPRTQAKNKEEERLSGIIRRDLSMSLSLPARPATSCFEPGGPACTGVPQASGRETARFNNRGQGWPRA